MSFVRLPKFFGLFVNEPLATEPSTGYLWKFDIFYISFFSFPFLFFFVFRSLRIVSKRASHQLEEGRLYWLKIILQL